MAQIDTQPFRFLDLPLELRLMVYDELSQIRTVHEQLTCPEPNQPDNFTSLIIVTRTLPLVNLLPVCRQLHSEASHHLQRHSHHKALFDEPSRLLLHPDSPYNTFLRDELAFLNTISNHHLQPHHIPQAQYSPRLRSFLLKLSLQRACVRQHREFAQAARAQARRDLKPDLPAPDVDKTNFHVQVRVLVRDPATGEADRRGISKRQFLAATTQPNPQSSPLDGLVPYFRTLQAFLNEVTSTSFYELRTVFNNPDDDVWTHPYAVRDKAGKVAWCVNVKKCMYWWAREFDCAVFAMMGDVGREEWREGWEDERFL